MAAVSKPVARIVNRHKANIVLPRIYAAEDDKVGRKLVLGTELDEGVVGAPPFEIALNAFERDQLRKDRVIRGMLKKRWIEFQGPSLDLIEG